jgi:hypothetical protein
VNAREQQTTLMKMANETIITPPSSGGSTSGETNFKTLDSLQMNGKHPNSSQPINNNKSYRVSNFRLYQTFSQKTNII